jgi:hypothetical protein
MKNQVGTVPGAKSVEYLPSVLKVLGLISSTTNTKEFQIKKSNFSSNLCQDLRALNSIFPELQK